MTKTNLLLCSQNREENDSNQNSSSVQGKCTPGKKSRCVTLRDWLRPGSLSAICVLVPTDQSSEVHWVLTVPGRPWAEIRAAPSRCGKFQLCLQPYSYRLLCLGSLVQCLSGGRDTDTDQREVVHLWCQRIWLWELRGFAPAQTNLLQVTDRFCVFFLFFKSCWIFLFIWLC